MIKKVIILLFISWQACFGQWKQSGIAEVISTNQSGIRDFVITEDSKFIYTLHDNGVIKKWDYETGDSLRIITIQRPAELGDTVNWFFLSKDGMTYCVINLAYKDSYYSKAEIKILDFNNTLIDSCYLDIYRNNSYGVEQNNYFFDFEYELKILTYSMNFTQSTVPPYFEEDNGNTYILKKINNKWEVAFHFKNFLNELLYNEQNTLLFLGSYQYKSGYTYGDSDHRIDYSRFQSVLYNTVTNIVDNISSYSYEYDSYKGTSVDGTKYTFTSSFFSRDNNYLYLSEGNKLYSYMIKDKELSPPITLSDYEAKHVRIERATDSNFFFVISNNEINLHDFHNGILYNTVFRSDISSIMKFSNAWDDNYVFFSDSSGNLYRIENKSIFRLWANFFANDIKVSSGKAVKFFDRTIGNPESYEWDFGDGTKSNDTNPVHMYENPGKYDVRLVVSSSGKKDTVLKKEYIEVIPYIKAGFDYEATGSNPVKIIFKSKSEGAIDSVRWYLGDGQTSAEINPEHMYNFSGIYTVKLIIFSRLVQDSVIKPITINITDKQIKNDFISWEFADTLIGGGGIALKGWLGDYDELYYHIKSSDSVYHIGAFKNEIKSWDRTNYSTCEYFEMANDGKFRYVADSVISIIDKNGDDLLLADFKINNKIYSALVDGNNLILTYIDNIVIKVLELNDKLAKFNSFNAGIEYYPDFSNIVSNRNVNCLITQKYKTRYDYIISNTYTVRRENRGNNEYYLKQYKVNNNSMKYDLPIHFIRLNDSILILEYKNTIDIIKSDYLFPDSSRNIKFDVLQKINLPDYDLKYSIKLNDSVFILAGSKNLNPAFLIMNATGEILDSLIITEREGSFNHASITSDANLLLSGYRNKYFGFPSPYFIKVKSPFIHSVIIAEKQSRQKNLKNLICKPNPAGQYAEICFDLNIDSEIKFRLFDISGTEIRKAVYNMYQGGNTIKLNLSGIPTGIYYYSIEAGGQVFTGIVSHYRE